MVEPFFLDERRFVSLYGCRRNNILETTTAATTIFPQIKPAPQRIKAALKKAPRINAEESAEVEAALQSFLSQKKPFLGSLFFPLGVLDSGQEAVNFFFIWSHFLFISAEKPL